MRGIRLSPYLTYGTGGDCGLVAIALGHLPSLTGCGHELLPFCDERSDQPGRQRPEGGRDTPQGERRRRDDEGDRGAEAQPSDHRPGERLQIGRASWRERV